MRWIALLALLTAGAPATVKFAAPIRPTPAEFKAATEAWRWRLAADAQPLLITALGDVFVRMADGKVLFLDTESGELTPAAASVAEWRELLQRPDNIAQWFRPDFVAELEKQHSPLEAPYVFSPTVPLILGGELTVENYTPSRWDAHLHVLGQIHRQVEDLPDGTPITKIHVDPW